MQKEAPLQKSNFDELNPDHIAYLQTCFEKTNLIFEHGDEKICNGVNEGYQYIRDTRLRFELVDILYHQDNEYYDALGPQLINTYGYCKETIINVFLTGRRPGMNHSGKAHGNYITMVDFYDGYVVHGQSHSNIFATVFAHELGHCFTLDHSWFQSQKTKFPDICQVDNGYCNPTPANDCPNNVMGYGAPKKFFSPLQIAAMYFEALSHNKVRYIIREFNENESIYITIPTLWDSPKFINGNIYIATGAELIVQCKLTMHPESRIVVHRGARLIVDGLQSWVTNQPFGLWLPAGGFITSSQYVHQSECSPSPPSIPWQGIEVWGNTSKVATAAMLDPSYDLAYDDPGVVIMRNGGAVWWAKTGVSCQARFSDLAPNEKFDYYGGLIDVNLGAFQNCNTAIECYSRKSMTVPSRLNRCYISTQTLLYNSGEISNAKGLVTTRVNGISVGNQSYFMRLNEGIVINHASMNIIRSNFQSCKYGVYKNFVGYIPSYKTMIGGRIEDRNIFDNCYLPIYGQHAGAIEASYNTFRGSTYGVVMDGPSIYDIKFNEVINDNAASPTFCGFAAINTGLYGQHSRILCNEFHNIGSVEPPWLGVYLGGDNNATVFAGNSFATRFDAYVTNQGGPGLLPEQKLNDRPNFNRFTSYTEPYHLADIYTLSPISGSSDIFDYFPPVTDCASEYMPRRPFAGLCHDPLLNSFYFNNNPDKSMESSLPSCIDFEFPSPPDIDLGNCGNHIDCLDSLNKRIEAIDSILLRGDNPALINAILSAPNLLTTLGWLTDATPLLSDSVLIVLAGSNVNVTFLTDLYLNHIPLNPRVIMALQDHNWNSTFVSILDSLSSTLSSNSRRLIMKERNDLHNLKYSWLRHKLDSLTSEGNKLEVVQLLNSDTSRISRQWLIAWKYHEGDWDGVLDIIDNWPTSHPHDVAYRDIMRMGMDYLLEETWVPSYSDSIRIQEISQIPSPYTGIANGLIYQIYGQLIDPLINLTTEVGELRENKRGEYVSSQLTNSKTLKVFPNPSFDVFYFNINGAVKNEQVTLYLYNAQGVVCLTDKRNINHKEVTTSGLPPGIYLLVVVMEDGERHVEKVTLW